MEKNTFVLTSPALAEGGIIPVRHTMNGGNMSLPLRWTGAPEETKSFVLIMHDQDFPWGKEIPGFGKMPQKEALPGGFFVHWLVGNIPATITELAEGASPKTMPLGTVEAASSLGLFQMPTAAQQYSGPMPPPGDPAHTYVFTLFALGAKLPNLSAGSNYPAVCEGMCGSILDVARLTGRFAEAAQT